jgi:hypothetical protein
MCRYNPGMRYRLRTLLLLLAVLPPTMAWGWSEYGKYREREGLREEMQREAEQLERFRKLRPGFQLDVF